MIGRSIGPFRIVEHLGESTLGTVYRAADESANREATIEILRLEYSQNADLNTRLAGVAATLNHLIHPAIATLYGFHRDGEDSILFSEFVEGETLENRLQRVGALPWLQASDLVLQLLDGLKVAHDAGILHGDVKPANILITPDGCAKLKDFGIARTLNLVGPEYLAPECIQGKPADQRSELYSLGLVLYRMLTGRMAFEGATKEELSRAQLEQAAKLPSELGVQLPQPVEQALMRALAKMPEYRWAEAAAFGAELRGALAASPAPAPAPLVQVPVAAAAPAPTQPVKAPIPPPNRASGGKKGLWIGLAGGVVLIGGLVGGYFGFKDRWKKPQPKPPEQSQSQAQPVPAPAPVAETQPPPTPVEAAPAPAPPVESPSTTTPVAAPASRAAVQAALEQTDGPIPAGAVAGSRPLHYAGILKATRMAGSGALVAEAVRKRGVNFRLNTNQTNDLRHEHLDAPWSDNINLGQYPV